MTNNTWTRTSWMIAAVIASLLAIPATAAYADAHEETGKWRWTGKLYLWGAGIEGTTITGGDIDVGFDDILDNLEFGLMGGLEASNGKWSAIGDFIYLDVEGEETSGLPGPGGGEVSAKAGVEGLVVNLLGGYRFASSEAASADLIFGARYLDVDVSLEANPNVPPPTDGRTFTGGDSVVDAVIGVRGGVRMSKSFYVPYILDVGAGESDLTWQIMVGIGWRPEWGEVTLAYRHLEWEFDSGTPVQDINFSGPGLLFKYHFN